MTRSRYGCVYGLWSIVLIWQAAAASTKTGPCRPNPCFNGGYCFRVANNTRNFQCRCRPDYVGERCESTDKTMSAVGVLCGDKDEEQSTDFSCPPSTVITVEYAAYGLPSNESSMACRHGVGAERACAYDGSLTDVMKLCHGANQCGLPPVTTLFAHADRPCRAVSGVLALEYRFRCQLAESEPISLTSQTPIETLTRNETALHSASTSPTSQSCTEPTDFYENGTCYRIQYINDRSKRKSWSDARAQCTTHGGELVGPVTADLHEKLSQKMKLLDERRVKYFWIGARVDPNEGDSDPVVRWTSGGQLDYLPEGSKVDEGECLVYYIQPGRTPNEGRSVWMAKSCSLYCNWICQFPDGAGAAARTSAVPTTAPAADPVTSTEAATTAIRTVRPGRLQTIRPPNRPSKVAVLGRNRTRVVLETPSVISVPTQETSTIAAMTTEMTTVTVTDAEAYTTEDTVTASTTVGTVAAELTVAEATAAEIAANHEVDGPEFGSEAQENIKRPVTSPNLGGDKATSSEPARVRIKVPGSGRPTWSTAVSPKPTKEGDFGTGVTTDEITDSTTAASGEEKFREVTNVRGPQVVLAGGGHGIQHYLMPTPVPDIDAKPVAQTSTWTTTIAQGGPVAETTSSTTEKISTHRGTILGAGTCDPVRERGIAWPSTREGAIAERPCPAGTEGTAEWECRRVSDRMLFYPPHPDLSDCRHMWFQEIEKQIHNGRYALKIAEDLHRYLTTSTKPVYGGDFKKSLSAVEQLFELEAKQLQEQNKGSEMETSFDEALKFTQQIGTIIDFLMSPDNAAVWQDLVLQDRLTELSLLMRLVEESASFLSRFMALSNSTNLSFNNYVMKMHVSRLAMTQATPSPVQAAIAPGVLTTPLNSEPDPDAAGGGAENSEFVWQQDKAEIALPVDGVIAMATQGDNSPQPPASNHRSLSDAAYSFGVAQPADPGKGRNDRVRLSYFMYTRTLNTLLQPSDNTQLEAAKPDSDFGWRKRTTVVNSKIIGAVVNDPRVRMALPEGQNVTVLLRHLITGARVENARCVYWDLEQHSWDTQGCDVVNSTWDFTVCTCNHLTSFAILMDINGDMDGQSDLHRNILKYLTMAGCALSAACLAVSVVVFTCFRTLWSVRNSVHRNLCLTLLIGELLFLFGVDETSNKDICTVIAVALHYFFLAAFCWMFMEGYQLYTMLVRVFEPPELSQLIGYYAVSYGAPAVVVAVSVGLGRQHYGTGAYCWINSGSPLVWAFVGPVAFVILANMLFLAVALKVACGVSTAENRSKAAKIRGWLKGSTILLCLLGLTWVFGFFFVIRPAILYFAYIFTVLNSLQGVSIFIFHVLLNEKVQAALAKWLKRHARCLPNYYSVNTKSGGSSNESRHWPTTVTASTMANYGFASTIPVSGLTNSQREMIEHRTSSRRRSSHEQDDFDITSQQRERRHSRRDNGYVASDDDGRNSRAMPVQIVRRAFDEDDTSSTHRRRPQAILPPANERARFPVVHIPAPVYENGTANGCRQMIFVSGDDRDRPYMEDNRSEPAVNRFYYSSDATLPHQNGYKLAAGGQKHVERF